MLSPSSKQALTADLSLLFIAISWGYTFVLTKDLLLELTPLYFLGTRFLLAAFLLSLWCWRDISAIDRPLCRRGLVTGLVLFLAYTLQIYGIERTTPGKAGMITGLSVVFVPFLYFFWARIRLQVVPLIGSLLAFIGLCLLSSGGELTGFGLGDSLVFCCAIAFAIHTVLVDRIFAEEPTTPPLLFAMLQLFVVGMCTTLLAAVLEPFPAPLSGYGWFAYLFDCFIGTLAAYIVQMKAQRYTPPTHVSLILALESLFAFLFSWLIWGEPLIFAVVIGSLCMLLGIIVTEGAGLLSEKSGLNR